MKHLFIINPVAKRIKGKVIPVKEKISAFFLEYPDMEYDVYVTEWCRDSIAFIHRYIADTEEIVRVHAIGGTGLLFEVINSVVDLPNAEVASYPYGKANSFIKYFGAENEKLFFSLKGQVFDRTVPMDIVRCGNNYGICYGMVGIEAYANALGDTWIEKGIPADISYSLAGIVYIINGKAAQQYSIEIDGRSIKGNFGSVMVANGPCYGLNMYPAIDAHPDDGVLDVYLFKTASTATLIRSVPPYTKGNYRRLKPGLISHYTARKVKLSSDSVMCMSLDGERFYGTSTEYEIKQKAIRFVCPGGIDLAQLPRIYKRPQEGLRGE